MYKKAYGIIETLAPLHVSAAAGEETGNLNLIFRDQFTQTGVIPGSSIRGRFRSDMRQDIRPESGRDYNYWYGQEADKKDGEGNQIETKEALIKFEYASIVWLPVYCPNQPVVWVSCPTLLKRYCRITGKANHDLQPYKYSGSIPNEKLFFNLGFLKLAGQDSELKNYLPEAIAGKCQYPLVVVDDNDMAMIHDMALYRQSRVALEDTQKKAKKGAFFNLEALPEGTVLAFPLAMREVNEDNEVTWKHRQFKDEMQRLEIFA
ncbi:RAMP superfamily CRISPR-associated protein [Tumidithrix elongata RA019]|uniref:RAMP superfamily CRISPR-associated protein n=1 Tax=Tumidithrix elongata BACA0141 TaxID=2716417 RepID=A0AAW9Q4V5_9CYAN|nr:RAMP superfamily CRISPR-associated protein [Tumidithrix elongata RA019]